MGSAGLGETPRICRFAALDFTILILTNSLFEKDVSYEIRPHARARAAPWASAGER
jgi:hypothetical protein